MTKATSGVLLGIICYLLVLLTGCGVAGSNPSEQSELTIVTSFYPIYIATINVVNDVSGVRVMNMTEPQTGCLHDYMLTPTDLQTLEQADVFVINGAGMEAFLDKVIQQQPGIKIIDASKEVELITDEQGNANPHVWVSISNTIQQVQNIGSQLAKLDSTHATSYQRNTSAYVAKLQQLQGGMHQALDGVPHRQIVTFHEAFPYFAQEFGLQIAAVVEQEPGAEPSPKELQQTIAIVKSVGVKALFVEPQYSARTAETIARETGAKVYTLDPVVTGDGSLDSYLNIMKENLQVLLEALR